METMNNILGAKGLTSSEANHVTNIVKELVKDLQIGLTLSTSYITEGDEKLPLDENKKNDNWVSDTQKSGKLYGLSAWLKTAIKFKERLLDRIERESFVSTIESPTLESFPAMPYTEFEEYLNQLNTKDRNEYLSAEAMAAHIGKLVHSFDEVRKQSDEFVPTSFMRTGERTVAVKSTRLYTNEELSEGFYTLQRQHRKAEKIVNLYKSRSHDWAKEVQKERNNKVKAIQSRNTDVQLRHNKLVEAERLDFENEKREEKKIISELKIIIPNKLQSTLEEVNKYAKD